MHGQTEDVKVNLILILPLLPRQSCPYFHHVRCPFVQKEKFKDTSFIKI